MTLRIGATAPDFEADTTHGRIRFHDWIGDHWAILFSHPKDFTPVCTTELGSLARLLPEFERRGAKVIGLSVDPVDRHDAWARDIEETQGAAITYPIIGDVRLEVAQAYDMLPADEEGEAEGRTAADNATVRTVFIIDPAKKIRAMLAYPMTSGRSFDEVLRLLDSLLLTSRHPVATPEGWRPGDDVIIVPSLADETAREHFPNGWRALKPYLRLVPQPRDA